MRALFIVLLICFTACSPAASSPSASPSGETPVTPAPTTGASPTASATLIPLPTSGFVAAASGGGVWMVVADAHLFLSLNRGETWTERTRPLVPGPQNGAPAFISAGEGWWLAPGQPGTQCTFQSVTLWKTDDGAATWRKLDATGIDDVRCKDAVAFSRPGVGYMTAHDTARPPVIYRTADGGKSWAISTPLPDPPGFTTSGGGTTLRVGNIADFGSVLFADAFGSVEGVTKHFAYRSVDGGATWSYSSTALQDSNVVFITPTRWIQITPPSDSRETTDAGKTWHFFPSDYQQAAPVAPQIACGVATTGYATVRGALQRTLDGGAHWSPLRTPGTYVP